MASEMPVGSRDFVVCQHCCVALVGACLSVCEQKVLFRGMPTTIPSLHAVPQVSDFGLSRLITNEAPIIETRTYGEPAVGVAWPTRSRSLCGRDCVPAVGGALAGWTGWCWIASLLHVIFHCMDPSSCSVHFSLHLNIIPAFEWFHAFVAHAAISSLHVVCWLCAGTVTHMPPELLMEGKMSKAVDVWSFGVVLWEMYVGRAPFAGLSHSQVLHIVGTGKGLTLPTDAPVGFIELLGSCLARSPDDR